MSSSSPAAVGPPLLSVCIPTYRRAHLVGRAIDSVLHDIEGLGLSDRVELLVADDGSGDESAAVLAAHRGAGRSFRFVARPHNLGMSVNLLTMLRDEARGDYVLIVTDDDTLVPGSLPILLAELSVSGRVRPGVLWTPRPGYREDGELDCVMYGSFPHSTTLPPSARVAGAYMECAAILSGLVLHREAIDFAFWSAIAENAYFPILVAGEAMTRRSSRYLETAVVRHTVMNKTHWERWGSTALDIDARLFSDFQSTYGAIGRRISGLMAFAFHAASVKPRAWAALAYASRPGGLPDIVRTKGTAGASEVLRRGGLPGGAVWPVLALGAVARRIHRRLQR